MPEKTEQAIVKATEKAIFDFAVKALEIAQAPYQVINNELILAECRVNVPRTFFTPAHVKKETLQLAANYEVAQRYPGTEWLTANSSRLIWLMEGIKKRGRIFRGTCLHQKSNLVYIPYLTVNFKISLDTDEHYEFLRKLTLNLSDGNIMENWLQFDNSQKTIEQLPPPELRQPRSFSYHLGFEILFEHLKNSLQQIDKTPIEKARERYLCELHCLESYFQDVPREKQNSFYSNAAELYQKFHPRLKAEIINVALIYA